MLRYLRYLLLALVALALLTMAMANRQMVLVRLLPEDMGYFAGLTWTIELPLFLVIFGGIVVGLLIGFFWEWARETKHRSAASTRSREVARLEREVTRLRDGKPEHQDEVLALLDARKTS